MNNHQVNRRIDPLQSTPDRFLATGSPCHETANLTESVPFDDPPLASGNMIGGDNDPYLVDNRATFKNVQRARQYLSPAKLKKWLGNVTTHSDATAGSGN